MDSAAKRPDAGLIRGPLCAESDLSVATLRRSGGQITLSAWM
jgi:hypothetical protein